MTEDDELVGVTLDCDGAEDTIFQLFQLYQQNQKNYNTIQAIQSSFQYNYTNKIQFFITVKKFYSIIENKIQLFYNTISKSQQFCNTIPENQLLHNAISKSCERIQRKIRDQHRLYCVDETEEEIQEQLLFMPLFNIDELIRQLENTILMSQQLIKQIHLQLQLQLSMQHFYTMEQNSFDQQIRQLENTILISRQLIQSNSVQQSQGGPDEFQMQDQQLRILYNNKRNHLIQEILNFYVAKVVDVTHENVDQCLMKNKVVGPELFADISKILCHSTYREFNYGGKKRCKWGEEASNAFRLVLGEYEEYISQLKTNHGYIKTGLWEYVSFILLSKYGHDYSPVQCAVKHKSNKET
ncbi:hypothetical protein GLOIN_2v1477106 [Rhizophagus clarus]|uniref:Uncharacterized protein n=1 Tax=Rhizophagus clarus TaxID=94130 RepID=A0A8H3KTC5_9GLOM|nr:hypothetical protein GLOIN_2v1477106 [Rhizophagus clarus]